MERSIRAGSFFARSKLPISSLVRVMYFWSAQYLWKRAVEDLRLDAKTVVDWYSFCRDIASYEMLTTEMVVGGPGHVVEIDETSLKKKSKNGQGTRHPDLWLFGGCDRTTGRWFGVLLYADRTKPTLVRLIKKHIRHGYVVLSTNSLKYDVN